MTLLGNEKGNPHFKVLCVLHMLCFRSIRFLSGCHSSSVHGMIHIFMTAADLTHFVTVIAGQCHGSGS